MRPETTVIAIRNNRMKHIGTLPFGLAYVTRELKDHPMWRHAIGNHYRVTDTETGVVIDVKNQAGVAKLLKVTQQAVSRRIARNRGRWPLFYRGHKVEN